MVWGSAGDVKASAGSPGDAVGQCRGCCRAEPGDAVGQSWGRKGKILWSRGCRGATPGGARDALASAGDARAEPRVPVMLWGGAEDARTGAGDAERLRWG